MPAKTSGKQEHYKMRRAMPEIDVEKCTGCGDCVDWCPTGAVALANGKAIVTSPEDCSYCAECETICPAGAIRCPYEIILVTSSSNL